MPRPLRVIIFGDDPNDGTGGVPCSLRHIPLDCVTGIVGASLRPQYINSLKLQATQIKRPFYEQPKPASAEYSGFKQWVYDLSPDLIWVNQYSMHIKEEILSIPRLGGINIHGGLLPQYRGCNSIQWSILNNEKKIGVTLHEMTCGIDEGNVIDEEAVPLFFEDTWKRAAARLSEAREVLVKRNINSILSHSWKSTPQNNKNANYFKRRKRQDGLFSWEQPALEIYNLIRALVFPLPGAFYINERGKEVVIGDYCSLDKIISLKKEKGYE